MSSLTKLEKAVEALEKGMSMSQMDKRIDGVYDAVNDVSSSVQRLSSFIPLRKLVEFGLKYQKEASMEQWRSIYGGQLDKSIKAAEKLVKVLGALK